MESSYPAGFHDHVYRQLIMLTTGVNLDERYTLGRIADRHFDLSPSNALFTLELEGGDPRPSVLQLPQQDSAARREAVALVHGFNNHYGEAAIAYQGFRKQQYRRDGSLLPPALEDVLADAHWPGDAAWGGTADLVMPRAAAMPAGKPVRREGVVGRIIG